MQEKEGSNVSSNQNLFSFFGRKNPGGNVESFQKLDIISEEKFQNCQKPLGKVAEDVVIIVDGYMD